MLRLGHNDSSARQGERMRYGYWERIADTEYYAMDAAARAQWQELRGN